MLVIQLRSTNGYPLRGEALTYEQGDWTYIKGLVLYREHDGALVGNLHHTNFGENVMKVLRKRGYTRYNGGWRIRTNQIEYYL